MAPLSSTFDLVDWGAAAHSLKVEIDYGNGLVDMGTTEFMSVPYSLHAKTAANADSTDELQTLTFSGDTIFLSGDLDSNFIVLPSPTLFVFYGVGYFSIFYFVLLFSLMNALVYVGICRPGHSLGET